jgi:hypothetical protein
LGALALLALSAAPVAADNADGEVTIMIMKHTCTEQDISSVADFEAAETAGEGASNPVAALVNTVLACPATGLPGDDPTEGSISNPRAEFDFTVTGGDGTEMTLADAEFTQAKLCESDVELDANGDGTISEDVCLDTSHYSLTVPGGDVTVDETHPPEGFGYGTLRFTPTEVDGNNDAESLQGSRDEEPLHLDTTADADGMIMLHIYNFEMATPNTDTVAVEPDSGGRSLPWAVLAFALVGGLGAMQFLRSRSQS